MNKNETMFEAIENVVDQLRTLELPGLKRSTEHIYAIRRRLQKAQDEYLKQGDRVLVTKKFEIYCCECNEKQLTEDEYYLHLRKVHFYPDEKACVETTNARHGYDTGLQELRTLLSEYTDTLLEDPDNG